MKATRDGFGDALAEFNDVYVLSADLSKATKTDKYAALCPENFIECGIAESNMIGIASGLSEYGKPVVISSFASFLTGRYDQIRCSIAYPNQPVILVGTHAGMAIGADGVTQMGLEDLALMRALPNMVVYNPSSYDQSYTITKQLLSSPLKTPVYLRLGRQPVNRDSKRIDPNEGFVVAQYGDSDTCILTTGCTLDLVMEYASRCPRGKIPTVIDVFRLKPFPSYGVIQHLFGITKIVTVEDHSKIGGLYSAVCEELHSYVDTINYLAIEDVFPESGTPEDLYKKYDFTVERLSRLCK
jgi:transketolase